MPLINGCKYSCEPCIRGHRVTLCNHTDRILIEIRKPGRPPESCGHRLATCKCGGPTKIFPLREILPKNIDSSLLMHESMPITSRAPPIPGDRKPRTKSTPKPRSRALSKVIKQPKGTETKSLVLPTSADCLDSFEAPSLSSLERPYQLQDSRQLPPRCVIQNITTSEKPPLALERSSVYSISSLLGPSSPILVTSKLPSPTDQTASGVNDLGYYQIDQTIHKTRDTQTFNSSPYSQARNSESYYSRRI